MISYIAIIFAASMGMNVLAALVIMFSGIRRRKSHFTVIAIGCLLAMLYQLFALQYHHSSLLPDALFWSKLQTYITLIAVPMYFLIFAQWSELPNRRRIAYILVAISTVFVVLNFVSDFGLRFSEMPQLIQYQIFGNETFYRLSGESSPLMHLFHAYGLLVVVFLMFIVPRLRKQGQTLVMITLLLTLVAQLGATLSSLLMQLGYFDFVYLSGLPFTLLNVLACITVAMSLERRSASLTRVVKKSEGLEKVLFSLAKGTQGLDSGDYYQEILLELQVLSGADMAYLGVIDVVNDTRYLQTKAAVYKKKPISNFSYMLDDIPSDLLCESDLVVVKDGLLERYPDIDLLSNVSAQAYIGAPLITSSSGLEGAIVLLYSRAIEPDDNLIKTLKVFASRAATECLREKVETDLRLMAYSDFKTQLPNLTSFNEEIKQRALFNNFNKEQSGVIVVDIDRFGQLNLQIGFENAEMVLRTLAERFKQYMKDTEHAIYVARTGGDEFGFLINSVDSDGAGDIRRHWQAISQLIHLPIKAEFSEIYLTCSAGAVIFPKQTTEQMTAYRCAEFAMREAKKAGRNQMKLFDMKILESIYRRQELEKSLELALSSKSELFLMYQPKVDGTGTLLGLEALCRWQSPQHGLVSPIEFIEIAEANGQIHRLGLWCIAQVCQQINHWKSIGFTLKGRVAINVSSKQLESEMFIPQITAILERYEIKPAQLDLELTESGLLKNVEDSIAKLKRLRELGFSVSLDDFGTGYSSLSYLKDLPLDCIKIDRCFVNEIDNSSGKLVQSVIAIGQHMGLDIVAEGVEKEPQVAILLDMGCRVFQGYYFSKPLLAVDVPNFNLEQQYDF